VRWTSSASASRACAPDTPLPRGAAPKALITGAAGQLGSELAALLPEAAAYDRRQLPIQDLGAVRAELERVRPEVVFNCAAYNDVDKAEAAAAAAAAANVEGPANLAAECSRLGIRLVHFSTNFVFDGSADRPYREADVPRPLGAYARSKLAGEEAVRDALPEALVVRTAGVFGFRGFPDKILARARAGQPLRVVADQRLNPTYARDLAEGALRLHEEDATGLVHLVAAGCCSFHELAVETLALAGIEAEVEAISSAELGAAAPRPKNGCLESSRVPPLRHWREGLRAYWEAIQTRSVVDTQPM
jgi:dTDP-4-dehydrorhamnose reductase